MTNSETLSDIKARHEAEPKWHQVTVCYHDRAELLRICDEMQAEIDRLREYEVIDAAGQRHRDLAGSYNSRQGKHIWRDAEYDREKLLILNAKIVKERDEARRIATNMRNSSELIKYNPPHPLPWEKP